MEMLYPMEKLAVRGYVEVLRHYREIVGIRRRLARHFLREPPALFIGVDAPDFNLDLEIELKAAGMPTVHYVSPAIWAWRRGRIHKMRRAVSKMLLVFPFERRHLRARRGARALRRPPARRHARRRSRPRGDARGAARAARGAGGRAAAGQPRERARAHGGLFVRHRAPDSRGSCPTCVSSCRSRRARRRTLFEAALLQPRDGGAAA